LCFDPVNKRANTQVGVSRAPDARHSNDSIFFFLFENALFNRKILSTLRN
jgi:hypothetical protein